MPRNTHQSALSAALEEIEKQKRNGVTDNDTLLLSGIVMYSAKVLESVEPIHVELKLRTIRVYRLLAVSMGINLIFTTIAAIASITYMIDRVN